MTKRRRLIVYNWLSSLLPDFGVVCSIRKKILRWGGVDVPSSVNLSGSVRFGGEGEIVIGENSTIRDGTFIFVSGGGRIELGRNVKIGENVILECRANPQNPGILVLGDNVDFMMASIASANGNATVKIGNNCKIAHNVSIKATEHQVVPNGKCIAGDCVFHDITISDGCWICAGAIIIPGVTVGRWNVIAAGAVVTKDTPDSVLMAGVPAIVKKRYQRV